MTVADRMLEDLERRLAAAAEAVAADAAVSPVTAAVLAEFERKLMKTRDGLVATDAALAREAVVELEQAADSAKAAVLADTGAAHATRDAVAMAHDVICHFKSTGELLDDRGGGDATS
jgi:hypothetical protein